MESHVTTGKSLVEPVGSTHEAEQLASYRSPSGLAIFSFLLGLASPLVFTAPLLITIPALAIALSLLALAKIAASDGRLFGRKAALVGLALAIGSACAVPAKKQVTNWLLSRQARPTALEWFDHLRHGQPDTAFQLTTTSQRPARNPSLPPTFGSSNESPIDQFRASPVVAQLIDWGERAKVQFDKTIGSEQLAHGRQLVAFQFTVEGPVGLKSLPVVLTMEKQGDAGTNARWRVENFQEADDSQKK